ncbi:hypothetical protein FQN60_006119, partial [Etheostoma spectabile]
MDLGSERAVGGCKEAPGPCVWVGVALEWVQGNWSAGPGGSAGPGPGVVPEAEEPGSGSGSGSGNGGAEWTEGGAMLSAIWETEGLQTVGIVVLVFASIKLLHLLGLISFSEDSVEDELELSTVRHRPEGLEQLEAQTSFSRKELQILYRGFKNECPSGVVNEETFKDIYAQFFPQGDASTYAHFLFNAFDTDHNGCVSFEDFVMGLSILLRGTIQEKLNWAFNLYDINKDGYITKERPLLIFPCLRLQQKMDKNKDGVVTIDEFIDCCQNLPSPIQPDRFLLPVIKALLGPNYGVLLPGQSGKRYTGAECSGGLSEQLPDFSMNVAKEVHVGSSAVQAFILHQELTEQHL